MQGSSYAPLQFLRSPWNRDVYTAIDNQIDGRTVLVLYLGAASTLPSELQKYNLGCILIHKDEKQIYLNTGNDTTPTWQSFGPGTNTLPTPFVPGQYLTNDGVDAFWSLIDLATGVTGLLDSDHIDLSDLANNSDFIDYLIGNSYFTSSLANDANFLTNLITNLNTGGLLTVAVDGVTITGDGTTGNPLVATGGGSSIEVEEDGVSIETGVTKINFTNGPTVTNPAPGEVDVDFSALLGAGGGTKVDIDTTQKTATNNSQTYTISVPGGILSTNNAIRFELPISSFVFTGTANAITIAATYGGTSVGSVSLTNPSSSSVTGGAIYKGIIMATGATNTQKGVVVLTGSVENNIGGAFELQQIDSATANAAVDSTVAQNLVVTITSAGTAATIITEGIIVEKITDSAGSGNSIAAIYGTDITDHTYVGYPAAASDVDNRVEKIASVANGVFIFAFPMGDKTMNRYSQLFTTGSGNGFSTQLVTEIQLYSASQFTNKSCEIDIYAESGGLPTGSSLGTLSGTYVNGGGLGGYWSLTTGTPITLNSSTNYCFVLKILTINNGAMDCRGYSYGTNTQVSTNSGATYSPASYGFAYKILLYNPLDLDKVYEINSSTPTMIYAGYTTQSKLAGQTGNVQISGLLSGFTGLTLGTQTVQAVNVGHAISTTEVMIVQPPL